MPCLWRRSTMRRSLEPALLNPWLRQSHVNHEKDFILPFAVPPESSLRAMTPTTSLSVIVPVYNEQSLVHASLSRLRVLRDSPLLSLIRVIVVDDGSRDQTATVLHRFRQSLETEDWGEKFVWHFVRHPRNCGKGKALRTGLRFADTELSVCQDADLEYHPRDLLVMIALFLKGNVDAVYGSRFREAGLQPRRLSPHRLINGVLTTLCNLVSHLNLSDMETCYKMVRTDLLKSIPLESNDFRIEPELTIKLAKRGARLLEVPIGYSARSYQEGKKISWKDGLKALLAIFKFAVSNRSDRKAST